MCKSTGPFLRRMLQNDNHRELDYPWPSPQLKTSFRGVFGMEVRFSSTLSVVTMLQLKIWSIEVAVHIMCAVLSVFCFSAARTIIRRALDIRSPSLCTRTRLKVQACWDPLRRLLRLQRAFYFCLYFGRRACGKRSLSFPPDRVPIHTCHPVSKSQRRRVFCPCKC